VPVYVSYRSNRPDEATIKDFKDLQDNNIDVSQLVETGQITASRQSRQQQEEVPYVDTGAGNGTQPSAILDILDK
jgi:hypothetical protein